MSDHKPMSNCFLCRAAIQYGTELYARSQVKTWGGILICYNCRSSNWDGIVPGAYAHLEAHLKDLEIEPSLNERGWIDIPA